MSLFLLDTRFVYRFQLVWLCEFVGRLGYCNELFNQVPLAFKVLISRNELLEFLFDVLPFVCLVRSPVNPNDYVCHSGPRF